MRPRPTARQPSRLLSWPGCSGTLASILKGNAMGKSATGLLEQQDPAQPAKKQAERKPQDVSPRAGRTGGLGARAERPSEGSNRKAAPLPQVGRGGKAPSAAGAPAQEGSAAEAKREKDRKGKGEEDLPQAARDSTM